jgi:hypothetical protein
MVENMIYQPEETRELQFNRKGETTRREFLGGQ